MYTVHREPYFFESKSHIIACGLIAIIAFASLEATIEPCLVRLGSLGIFLMDIAGLTAKRNSAIVTANDQQRKLAVAE